MEIVLNGYYTLILATLVLLLGKVLVKKIKFLSDFNIPEPVAGGLVAAAIVYSLYAFFGYTFTFQKQLQTAFMLMFFASIGLSADFSRLRAGGLPLLTLSVLVSIFIIIQNAVGVGSAMAMGLDPMLGLVAGSISLTGGHGTAGAWGATLEQTYGVAAATTLGIACATYGLVAGGVIGGPVAQRLINKMGLKAKDLKQTAAPSAAKSLDGTPNAVSSKDYASEEIFEKADSTRLITATAAIETLALFAACLAFADIMTGLVKGTWLELPTFVWALFGGVMIRNVLTIIFNFEMFDRAIDVFGNAALSLFLAMALLSLKLWELAGLGLPILVILIIQTIVMILYAIFVTFRFMGRDYDAAVLAAGHCGFGLGATPTAIANMQAITDRYLPSHKAFLIVPMVGAFFVDIVNVIVLQTFTKLPFM
ncbi:sodium/glutamate symporter [Moraxella sp. Tifton1]|uniref:sodium/glutamate symporter n=1 Tax=Moraxella oculi TaxID=2940516 RepID=UPI0020139C32|nr:sodium/glutamate symporter [Moraxella sp. Tifton1]MCL1623488.1 sodium/glutamate symporter [Moraxella sp. Tifton1]